MFFARRTSCATTIRLPDFRKPRRASRVVAVLRARGVHTYGGRTWRWTVSDTSRDKKKKKLIRPTRNPDGARWKRTRRRKSDGFRAWDENNNARPSGIHAGVRKGRRVCFVINTPLSQNQKKKKYVICWAERNSPRHGNRVTCD